MGFLSECILALTEAERSRRKSAMPIELLRRKDGSTRSSSDHFMHRQVCYCLNFLVVFKLN